MSRAKTTTVRQRRSPPTTPTSGASEASTPTRELPRRRTARATTAGEYLITQDTIEGVAAIDATRDVVRITVGHTVVTLSVRSARLLARELLRRTGG